MSRHREKSHLLRQMLDASWLFHANWWPEKSIIGPESKQWHSSLVILIYKILRPWLVQIARSWALAQAIVYSCAHRRPPDSLGMESIDRRCRLIGVAAVFTIDHKLFCTKIERFWQHLSDVLGGNIAHRFPIFYRRAKFAGFDSRSGWRWRIFVKTRVWNNNNKAPLAPGSFILWDFKAHSLRSAIKNRFSKSFIALHGKALLLFLSAATP